MKKSNNRNGKKKSTKPKLIGRYIVADPKICHGQPTFRGTRIMVWQVLEMAAKGMTWETIVEQCHNSITKEAIAEALILAREVFTDRVHEYTFEPTPS